LEAIVRHSSGAVRKRLYFSGLSEIELTIPTIEEQQKSIKRFALIEKASQIILNENSDKLDIPHLKQAILQEAIQGKLTPDWRAKNPDTEPASELLKRIQTKKARLIAEKKIRKEKPLPEITAEKIPFEIPERWEWCRLGFLGFSQTGTTPSKTNPSFFGSFVPFIKPGDILNQNIDYENEGLSETGLAAGRTIEANSILMVCIGSSTGKVAVTDRRIWCNQQINSMTLCGDTLPPLIEAILASPFFQESLWDRTKTGITPIINKSKWCSILIPLSPLAEQAAIVARVEALMATCRELETEIENSRTHAADLLQAVLKEAFSSK
jgi:type I restriction enzyme S subunit